MRTQAGSAVVVAVCAPSVLLYGKLNILMLVNEIILEQTTDFPAVPWDEIRVKCSDIIAVYRETDKVLYHGEMTSLPWFAKETPINRKPKDTPIYVQDFFDYVFNAAGFKALRSNSLYVTGNRLRASSYGNIYIIFPVNGFAWAGSSEIGDLYSFNSFSSIAKWNVDQLKTDLKAAEQQPDSVVSPGVKSACYGALDRIEQQRRIGNSLFIDWPILRFVYVLKQASTRNPYLKALYKKYNYQTLVDPKQFVNDLSYNQNPLTDLIGIGNEILIHGYYYAVAVKFEDEVYARFFHKPSGPVDRNTNP